MHVVLSVVVAKNAYKVLNLTEFRNRLAEMYISENATLKCSGGATSCLIKCHIMTYDTVPSLKHIFLAEKHEISWSIGPLS